MVKKKTTSIKSTKKSKEFEEKKEILELQDKLDIAHHERKMKELEYARASDKIKHDLEMERQRIRSAEIQRTIARKEQSRQHYRN